MDSKVREIFLAQKRSEEAKERFNNIPEDERGKYTPKELEQAGLLPVVDDVCIINSLSSLDELQQHEYELICTLLERINLGVYWFLISCQMERNEIINDYLRLIDEWERTISIFEMSANIYHHIPSRIPSTFFDDIKEFISPNISIKTFKNGKIKLDDHGIKQKFKELTEEKKAGLLLHYNVSEMLLKAFRELEIYDLVNTKVLQLINALTEPITTPEKYSESYYNQHPEEYSKKFAVIPDIQKLNTGKAKINAINTARKVLNFFYITE